MIALWNQHRIHFLPGFNIAVVSLEFQQKPSCLLFIATIRHTMITLTQTIINQYGYFIAMLIVSGGLTYLIWRSQRRTITIKDPTNRRITHVAL